MIRLEGVSFSHGREAVIRDCTLRIAPGEACAIIGPSGCGKTTLLHLMAGLLRPSRGQVLIAGTPLTGPRRQSGLIIQDLGLFPWKTARENIALGHLPATTPGRVDWLLAELGLDAQADKFPHQLSGGQRQRVAIARALVRQPDILLLDEAASALDALSREALQALIRDLWRRNGLTLVLVTHSIEEALVLGSRILVMDRGGTVHQSPAALIHAGNSPAAPFPSDPRDHPDFAAACRDLRRLLASKAG